MMTESLRKNGRGILLMVFSSLFVCFGQLLWKLSADGNVQALLCGFLLYGLGALAMMAAYRFGSLSVLQPILSINYVLSCLIGCFGLGEHLTVVNVLGVAAVFIGVILIAGGD
jgi:uncharacterized membrane protein